MIAEDQTSLVVLASPYEGSLYWMFEETRSSPEHQLSHPYYAGLYGQKAAERTFRSQAAAAICLFEDVLLLGADAFVPNGVQTNSVRVEVAEDEQFCHALLQVADPIEREREFVRAIRTALDYEAISKRTAGVLETTASASGVAGLVPLLGIVPGIAGLVADASARSARLAERKSRWPLVGVRMQEIATRDFLKRKENVAM
jgi:hypothetical protein